MEIGIGVIALDGLVEAADGGREILTLRLHCPQVVVHLVERQRGGHQLEALFGAIPIAAVIAAQAQEESGLEVMRVRPPDALEPAGGHFVVLFPPVGFPELKTGLGVVFVKARRLREEPVPLFRR